MLHWNLTLEINTFIRCIFRIKIIFIKFPSIGSLMNDVFNMKDFLHLLNFSPRERLWKCNVNYLICLYYIQTMSSTLYVIYFSLFIFLISKRRSEMKRMKWNIRNNIFRSLFFSFLLKFNLFFNCLYIFESEKEKKIHFVSNA